MLEQQAVGIPGLMGIDGEQEWYVRLQLCDCGGCRIVDSCPTVKKRDVGLVLHFCCQQKIVESLCIRFAALALSVNACQFGDIGLGLLAVSWRYQYLARQRESCVERTRCDHMFQRHTLQGCTVGTKGLRGQPVDDAVCSLPVATGQQTGRKTG